RAAWPLARTTPLAGAPAPPAGAAAAAGAGRGGASWPRGRTARLPVAGAPGDSLRRLRSSRPAALLPPPPRFFSGRLSRWRVAGGGQARQHQGDLLARLRRLQLQPQRLLLLLQLGDVPGGRAGRRAARRARRQAVERRLQRLLAQLVEPRLADAQLLARLLDAARPRQRPQDHLQPPFRVRGPLQLLDVLPAG